MDDCSRRQLLGRCAAAACAPLLGGALQGCARRIVPARQLALGAPVAGKLRVTRAQAPELDQVGGCVSLHPAGTAPVLLCTAENGFFAVDATCPHAGCELSWVAEDLQVECPCHGSRFATDGTVLAPPALVSIAAYAAAEDKATHEVIVDLFAVLVRGATPLFDPVAADGTLTVAVADHPELGVIGGAAIGYAAGLQDPVAIVRSGPAELLAYDAACTHQRCTVDWLEGSGIFVCYCHGSRFGRDGALLQGPADRALAKLTVKQFVNGVAVIQVR